MVSTHFDADLLWIVLLHVETHLEPATLRVWVLHHHRADRAVVQALPTPVQLPALTAQPPQLVAGRAQVVEIATHPVELVVPRRASGGEGGVAHIVERAATAVVEAEVIVEDRKSAHDVTTREICNVRRATR